MQNHKAQEAINLLSQAEDVIRVSDFTGLLEENDTGFRERAVEHIEKATAEIVSMMAAEDKQRQSAQHN